MAASDSLERFQLVSRARLAASLSPTAYCFAVRGTYPYARPADGVIHVGWDEATAEAVRRVTPNGEHFDVVPCDGCRTVATT